MARALYSLLLYLGLPLVWLRLLWRSRRQPEYLGDLGERWGRYDTDTTRRIIWVHAVSVGETRAAAPLVEALLAAFPDHDLLLTCMTPTGRAAGREVFGERVIQAYLPYDYPHAAGRFLDHFRPSVGILMETEVWPNLLAAAKSRSIPVALVNARLSLRSASGYARLGALTRPAFASLAAVAAQTPADGERLSAAGAKSVKVCGNLKFDVTPAPALISLGQSWRESLGGRPVFLAASTREGEEALLLDALRRHPLPEATLLVVVPRHPQRFDEVANLLAAREFLFVRRSEGLPEAATAVWLGDSMGEMAAYYALADAAFIGGSLLPLGGQNLVEAAACGCPVLIGPHTFNFAQATEDAIASGTARRIADADELAIRSGELLADRDTLKDMAKATNGFMAAHRGATRRVMEIISPLPDRAGR